MQTISPRTLSAVVGGAAPGNEALNALGGGPPSSPSSSPGGGGGGLGSLDLRNIQPADNRAFTNPPDSRFQSPDMRVTSPQSMPWGQINDMFKQMGM